MKSLAFKIIFSWLLVTIVTSSLSAQTRCACRPSPPGGTTTCSEGQIAICGTNRFGVCEGSCKTVNVNLTAPQYFINLLSKIVGKNLSLEYVNSDRTVYRGIIKNILNANETHETFSIEYSDYKFRGTLGLPEIAVTK